MFVDAYLQVATHLIEIYDLQMPLHLFLKEYFKNNKKYGSRDRKYIAELVYGYYRLSRSAEELSIMNRLLLGAFLSARLPKLFFEKTNPDLAKNYDLLFSEKLTWIKTAYAFKPLVSFGLSNGLTHARYLKYLFSPTNIFIRIRRNKQEVIKRLTNHNVHYKVVNDECFSFSSKVDFESILQPADFVVQDYASQQTGQFFKPAKKETWWDCCCASGGKSIMLLDKYHLIDLTLSDVRSTIMQQLHTRMQRYGYGSSYRSFVGDIALDVSFLSTQKMDAIICDVPCSGSGTWARSPEQFYFFTDEKLMAFHNTQVSILNNAISQLKPDGVLYYITCSIFEEENLAVVEAVSKNHSINIRHAQLVLGDELGADNMFICEMAFR